MENAERCMHTMVGDGNFSEFELDTRLETADILVIRADFSPTKALHAWLRVAGSKNQAVSAKDVCA